MAGVHVPPEIGEYRYGFAEIIGQAGNAGYVDGTCRRAAKYGERIPLAVGR